MPQNYIQYTGTNYAQVKVFVGEEHIMAPYFCMGFSMITLMNGNELVNVNEGDYIFKDADGQLRVETSLPQ